MIADVVTRLEARVPDLSGRVDGAAAWARLTGSGAAPAGGLSAFVLPGGLQGRPGQAAAGAFTQPLARGVSVIVLLQSVDRAGERALMRLEPLLDEIVAAVAGWAPGDSVGVFELVRGQLISAAAGLLAYQIEFSITDQLRIMT